MSYNSLLRRTLILFVRLQYSKDKEGAADISRLSSTKDEENLLMSKNAFCNQNQMLHFIQHDIYVSMMVWVNKYLLPVVIKFLSSLTSVVPVNYQILVLVLCSHTLARLSASKFV